MTKLEKLYSIIENSREVGVKLSKDVLQQVLMSRDSPLAQAIFFLQAGPMMIRAYCSPLI